MQRLDRYPIPKVEDLGTPLNRWYIWTTSWEKHLASWICRKLDMSQAYQHIPLDKNSRKYVVYLDDILGKTFSKLDMSQAYQHIPLDKNSRKYVVINTHRGLFQYNRLPFGVSSAPGIFQRVMESLLSGVPNVVVYLDDILVTGPTEEEHLAALEEVLRRLQAAGLRLKR